jgi:alpha-tubulin suppressor-like RCC1 family protein
MKTLLVAAAALIAASSLGAQAPASAPLIRDASVGAGTLVVKADGSVVTWGRSPGAAIRSPIPLDLPGKAVKVDVGGESLGFFTGYAVLENGTVFAWGSNHEGQIGNGPSGANGELGRYPKPSPTPVKVTDLTNIIDIAAGNTHAVALGADGTVWAWGSRENGALGDGEPRTPRLLGAIAPVRVAGLANITQIAVGDNHSLALTREGHVMAWGAGHSGALGTGTRDVRWTPARVVGLDGVVAIAAGNSAGNGVSGAVKGDGTVWMWGAGTSGMMGNGGDPLISPDDPGGRQLEPVQVKGLANVKQLAIGGANAAALLADGTLRMWGHNGYGETGSGSANPYEPRPVKNGLTNVAAVYLANMRSAVVKTDGTFWVWGFPYSPATGVLAKSSKLPVRVDLP